MQKRYMMGTLFLAGSVLAALSGQPQAQVHADDQTPTATTQASQPVSDQAATIDTSANTDTTATAAAQLAQATPVATQSQVPAGQTVQTTGTNDIVTPATADTTDYPNVGDHAKVMISQQYDDNGNQTGVYKVNPVNRDAYTSDTAPSSNEGVQLLDAESPMNGDTTHYAEYVNGAWKVNSLTMQGGQDVAGRESFNVDVTNVVSGAEVAHDYTVVDGVNVHVGSAHQDQALNDQYGNTMVTGAYLTVTISGANAYSDNHESKVSDPDEIAQLGTGFVNVPFTFHYYDAQNQLITGTLNFVNGEITTPTTGDETSTPTTGDDNTTPSTGDETSMPTTGDDNTTPSTGDDTSTPATSDNTTPSTGDSNAASSTNNAASTPASAGQTAANHVASQTNADPAQNVSAIHPLANQADSNAAHQNSLPTTGDAKSPLALVGVALMALFGGLVYNLKRRA